jgi:hypothetical protein
MTLDQLTAVLAERVMGWTVGPERFLMGNGKWLSRWKFQPAEKVEDALRLLESAAPQEFAIQGDQTGITRVRVRIAGAVGETAEVSLPLAITHAVARAIGIQIPEMPQLTGPNAAGTARRNHHAN